MSAPKLDMVNFRPTEKDRRILESFMQQTGHGPTYILRRGLYKVTLQDLVPVLAGMDMTSLDTEEEANDQD